MLRRSFIAFAAAISLFAAADRRFVIVLIGPTGSGKTTQAVFLKKRYGLPSLNIADVIQRNRGTLKAEATPGINEGSPQDSLGINQLVRDRLKTMNISRGLVLDGYPATKDQADYLERMLREMNLPSPVIIQIDVPDNVARERLRKRHRADDSPSLIEQRLKDYHREMDMIRAYYPKADIWTIDGAKSPAEVSRTIVSILEDEMPKRTPGAK